ncbi:MAG: sterol desaturase family protein [Bacteroidia bacterium]|nr:sterol desaturase family protein [Bacteroidia bacterium]
MELLELFSKIYLSELFNYFLAGSIGFGLFYVIFKKKWFYQKIQLKDPKNKDFIREIRYSLFSMVFFTFTGILIVHSPLTEYTKIYTDINAMPMWYYWLSFPIMAIMHDTYFYWMHRTLHHPALFKHTHLVHHKSTNPSPWAAYSFHPFEAILEALIFPIMVLIIPLHLSAVASFFLFSIFYNVYGHLGYELYPKGFNKHWLGRWINTSIHHNLHHKHFDNSYGLYFTFWDRVMGTMAPQYDDTFDEVKSRKTKLLEVEKSKVT